MASTGYPPDRVRYVKGPVERTIPDRLPGGPIALLRLDTDWYESTRHELLHLFPLLSPGGVLIIDDYGHWSGARKAVDEYLGGLAVPYRYLPTSQGFAIDPDQVRASITPNPEAIIYNDLQNPISAESTAGSPSKGTGTALASLPAVVPKQARKAGPPPVFTGR